MRRATKDVFRFSSSLPSPAAADNACSITHGETGGVERSEGAGAVRERERQGEEGKEARMI